MSLLATSLLTPYFFSPSFFLPSPPYSLLLLSLLPISPLLPPFYRPPYSLLLLSFLLDLLAFALHFLSFCSVFSQLLHGIFLAFGIRTYKELIFKKFCSLDEISCHTVVISPHGRHFRDFAPSYPSIEEWKQRECIMEGQPSNKC